MLKNTIPKTRKLEDCMESIIDYRGKTPKKTNAGIPLITAKIIKDGCIKTPNEFISFADYPKWMTRGYPEVGDVVLTTEAPLGEVAQIKMLPVALAQRIITLRGKSDILDNRYLFYLLQTKEMQAKLHNRSTGTTVTGIKQSELRNIEIEIPPLAEQRAIAHILGALDDKIELNRRMNQTLENMAQALLDFDGVSKKDMQESELGLIPKGWRVGTLGDVAEQLRRSIRPEAIEKNTLYIALEHMPKRCISLDDWGIADDLGSNKYVFKRGEILFGKLRPYFHKVGIAPIDGVCSTDIVVMVPKSPIWFGFVLFHAASDTFVKYVSSGATGTRMPRTSWSEMARYSLALPPEPMLAAFNQQAHHIAEKIISNVHQSRTLVTLRDTLLPKLLSGKLFAVNFEMKEIRK